jgi:putative transposon-encoded protein
MIKCIYMKAKLKKIGNSMYILIPKKIAEPFVLPGEIEVFFPKEVEEIRNFDSSPAPEKIKKTLPEEDKNVITVKERMPSLNGSEFCKKHKGSRKWTCGCK